MPLKRTLSLTLISFYGLGTILGAGIYALVGEVANVAKSFTPIAFLSASLIAFLTACSYAELSARFPQSAGSALYIRKAFHLKWLSGILGWLVVLTGVVSSATLAHGFVNYFEVLFPVSSYIIITIIALLLGFFAAWGIKESATLIMIMTLVEISGLLLVIFYGREAFTLHQLNKISLPSSIKDWQMILSAAFLSFYAYIGFEDMVNTAEETINPEKNIPYGIFLALVAATILYLLVSWVVTVTLPIENIVKDKMPLIQIIRLQGQSALLFNVIALFAIMNGILVQIIMASRLIYGMANQQNAPRIFAKIYSKTHTPLYSTLFVVVVILIFSYAFPITTLAKLTSTIMFLVFIMVHCSLIKIKLNNLYPSKSFNVPFIVPLFTVIITILFLLLQLFS